jgi:hypothetical protein
MTLSKLLTSLSCTELLSCVEDSVSDSVEDNAKDIDYAENETSAIVLDEFEENANTVLQIFRTNRRKYRFVKIKKKNFIRSWKHFCSSVILK